MKSKTSLYAFGAALLVVFAGFSYTKFTEALTPYVSYEEAIATPRSVQVAGGLEKDTHSYDTDEGNLHFTLVDPEKPGKTLKVRYQGVKPANFEDAISIVAIGKWDQATEEFAAHDLLVKCPSKYQGVEDYDGKSYGSEDGYKSYGSEGEHGYKSYGSEGETATEAIETQRTEAAVTAPSV